MALSITIEDHVLAKRFFLWVSREEIKEVYEMWHAKDNVLSKILRKAGITSARDMFEIEGETWRTIVAGSLIRFSYDYTDCNNSQSGKTLKYTCAAMIKSFEYKTGMNVDHLKIIRFSDSSYSFNINGGSRLTLEKSSESVRDYLKSPPKFSIVVDNTKTEE